jgi:hypothetical protein
MKKTLQDQYLLIKEGKGHKGVFLTEAKRQFPDIVRNAATFNEAAASLITKNIIAENVISLGAINSPFEPKKKQSYETAFEAFLAEAQKKENEDEKVKAEEKKVSKKVEEDASHNFDYKDDKNPDNMIFGQIMMGYYAEMKDPKNADKTMQELKDIVFKNLSKNQIYYTENAQFGVKDLGYTTEAPALGEPKEAKGKYKSSGYGDLKEGYEKFVSDVKDAVTKKSDKKFSPEEIKAKLKKKREEELERRKKAGESLEEITLRKAIQEMIDEELNSGEFEDTLFKLEQPHLGDKEALTTIQKIYSRHSQGLNSAAQNIEENEVEEAYQLFNIEPVKSDKERNERDPQPFLTTYIDPSVVDSLTKNQHLRILRNPSNPENITLAIRATLAPTSDKNLGKTTDNLNKLPLDIPTELKGFLTDKNNLGGEKKLPTRIGEMVTYKVLNNATLNKNGSLVIKVPNPRYQKTQESLREGVEKDLAAINKEAEHEVLQSKMEKIQALIDKKQSQISRLDEDEDMKDLTDDKKVKEISKDIKALEKAKVKLERLMSKFKGKKPESKKVIDEMDNAEAIVANIAPEYIEDANERLENGEEIDSILSNYQNLSFNDRNHLRNYLDWKQGEQPGLNSELGVEDQY